MSKSLMLVTVVALVGAACSSTPSDEPASESAATTATTTTTLAASTTTTEPAMEITSPSFEEGAAIPEVFSCDGDDISPELRITNVPDSAVTLALIMDDPDAPGGTWVHWVAFDFPPTDVIAEGIPLLGIGGNNSWGRTGYGGPCPPGGTHRYFFKLFALDEALELPEGSTVDEVLNAMEGHIVGQAELMGTYTR